MACEQFSICWDSFLKNMSSGMSSLLENEDLVDVTLAIEGRYLKAHKMVLSVCSSYFRELFKTNPCTHPIVFMKDVSFEAMSNLLQFMYKGEVQVSEENFNTFIKTAESLQIKGLSNYGNSSSESATNIRKENVKLNESKVPIIQNETVAPKRLRLNVHTDPYHQEILKTEPAVMATTATSTLTNEEEISFKTEPYDEEESSFGIADDNSNENFLDDPLDETNTDGNSDHWMMQGGEELPLVYNMVGTLAVDSVIRNIDEDLRSSKIERKSTKTRSKNFTYTEIAVLVEEVAKHRNVLFGPLKGPALTQLHRDRAWEEVVMAVNKVAPVVRGLDDIKKKFRDLKTRTKQKVNALRTAGVSNPEGGPLSAAERRLMSLIRKD